KKLYAILTVLLVFTFVFSACAKPAVEEAQPEGPPVVEEAPAEEEAEAEEVSAEEVVEEAPLEEAPLEEAPVLEAPMVYQEAPILAEKVAAGELPPVEERIPENPFVVGPGVLIVEQDLTNWQSGIYGGTLNMAHRGDFPPDIFIGSNEGYLAAPGISVEGIIGNVLEGFSVNEDATQFTFTMRKGLKWSDGVPVTRADVEFAWLDVMNNEEIFPTGIPGKWRTGALGTGNPMTLEFVDDWTFVITFDGPYGSLLREMAVTGWVGYTDLIKPAHYLKQFHKSYADPDELLEMIKAEGYEDMDAWVNLFTQKDISNWEMNIEDAIGFPRLYPFLLVEITEGAKIYERNPYYYKVDVEGKQLPYIDRIVTARVDDVEMVNMRAIAGQVDFTRESPDIMQIPVYKEQEAAGNFTASIYSSHVAPMCFFFNQANVNDEAWNEVINDVRFRQALNYAIDREEIISTIYFGLAEPAPWNPSEYSVEKANALLDEMGMTERDDKGFRLTPSGKPLLVYISSAKHLAEHESIAELTIEYWAEIGINATLEVISNDLLSQRNAASETMTYTLWSVAPMWVNATWTDWIPQTVQWSQWMNPDDGIDGVEPPDAAKRLWEIRAERAAAVPGTKEDMDLYNETVQSYIDNIWSIIVVKGINPLIISNDLCNIPTGGQAIAANYSMEQFFFCEGSGR
ncbi:MAG TPA: ABC transporter substrate-binding protein, partial [Chloroflexi bacterium]|nr:ABC transporter substrate-binding protein [Chloroflexota bacterium]